MKKSIWIKTEGGRNYKKNQGKNNEGEGRNKKTIWSNEQHQKDNQKEQQKEKK